MFEGNEDVVFGDVNLSEGGPRGDPHNPGSGGWPTIRYFTKETGIQGASYEKRTSKSMCDELGNRDMLIDYIESSGEISLCDADSEKNCNEKEKAYLAKMKSEGPDEVKKQKARLDGMAESGMKSELQEWLIRRRRILSKLVVDGEGAGAEL